MKKFSIIFFSVCICLTLSFLSQFSVFAESSKNSNDVVSVDISETSLSSKDDTSFNEDVASDDAFINLVIQAAQYKGKSISLEGIHPGKSIKLYGINNSENLLQSLYDSYTETGTIEKMISKDYSVLKLYVNKNDEYVDSLVFTKEKNLSDAKAKNGWVQLCSGSMVLNDEFIVEYSEEKNLKKYVTDLGLKNPKKLKIISSIPHMPVSIYFVQNNIEFLIPLDDSVNMKALQVYKVSDVFDNYLKPILDFQNEKAKEYENLDPKDIPNGTPQVPDEFPAISPINMYTYFDSDNATINKTDFRLIITIGFSIVILLVGIIVACVIKKSKKRAT